MSFIVDLIDLLRGEEYVFIQPHNFPDHDAVASAYGLKRLFEHHSIPAHIVYEKDLQRENLRRIIRDMSVDMRHGEEFAMRPEHKIVLVDGCKGNGNVTSLTGTPVAVIDHHNVEIPDDVPLNDIRPDFGACASIIASYYRDLNLEMPGDVATLLMVGISMDTTQLTRGASIHDLEMYFRCYPQADVAYVNTVCRNSTSITDLKYYSHLIQHLRRHDRVAFCHFPQGCSQNLLGILADFTLSLIEIDFVALSALNKGVINLSLRSDTPDWDASKVAGTLLKEDGFGGGHTDMAGGIIKNPVAFDPDALREDVVGLLGV